MYSHYIHTCIYIAPLNTEKRLKLQKQLFTISRNYIVQYLNPDIVMDDLTNKQLISQDACRQMKTSVKSVKEKNKVIVDELSNGGPNTVEKFCEILKENRGTKFMADKLERGKQVTSP